MPLGHETCAGHRIDATTLEETVEQMEWLSPGKPDLGNGAMDPGMAGEDNRRSEPRIARAISNAWLRDSSEQGYVREVLVCTRRQSERDESKRPVKAP